MCGISGIFRLNQSPVANHDLLKMTHTMRHRGPDDQGLYTKGPVGLGFVRLAIIDLSTNGHQPMSSDDGQFTIVFNGEIYNYLEIKTELSNKGLSFSSQSDTEVLLKAYQTWGRDCLKRLNGMFAFAVYDHQQKSLFLARDRFGIKPLYYYKDQNQFIFCSEIQPILEQITKTDHNINEQAVFDYLVHNRSDHGSTTFFSNIHKLQPGHCIDLSKQNFNIKRWYNLQYELKPAFENAEAYREGFTNAIGLQLRSDVPIGVSLSGGLDSSSITSSLIHDYNRTELHTFSAIYGRNLSGDESPFIDEYRQQLGNMHFVTPTSDSLLEDLTEFIEAHGEPVQSTGPYAQFKVMELAHKHVKVTLDGQGADEALAGYHYFFGFYYKELLKQLRWVKLALENYSYINKTQSTLALQSFIYFLMPSSFKTKMMIGRKGFIHDDLINSYAKADVVARTLDSSPTLESALLNHFELKLEHLLKWEDRNSMHFSIEARVPFLDHNLVEKTLSLPAEKLLSAGETKAILRQAMRGVVPKRIIERKDKIGFGTPQDDWFRQDKFKQIIDGLLQHSSPISRFIDIKKAKIRYQYHLNKKINIGQDIWKWINLDYWLRNNA